MPAGGRGDRFGGDRAKQFVEVAGRPLLAWTAERLFAAGVEEIVIALPEGSRLPEDAVFARRVRAVVGGASRQESVAAGILNYPVLQAADILLYKADTVPVGEDQVQHLELSREISRRWNARFGEGFFPEPQARLTPTRRIMGLDGQAKMSKSLGNTVSLLETPDEMWKKLRPAMTDPARVRREDPGTPEICNIYHLHKAFSPAATVDHVAVQCRTAGWGCIDCKKVLFENMNAELTPIRTRAAELTANPSRVKDALDAGAAHAASIARNTMADVKQRMGLS